MKTIKFRASTNNGSLRFHFYKDTNKLTNRELVDLYKEGLIVVLDSGSKWSKYNTAENAKYYLKWKLARHNHNFELQNVRIE